MSKQKKIVSYLCDRYNPQALILHGSRATGYATEHSDWDFFLLTDDKIESFSETKFEQEIDVVTRQLPIDESQIGERFGCRLKHGKVVCDTNDTGKDLLQAAANFYNAGFNITQKERQDFKNKLRRTYYRLEERSDNIAHLYRLDFVSQAVRLWYQILQNEWQDNFYIAFPRMKSDDKDYYQQVASLLETDDKNERLQSARWIYERLFAEGVYY